jgi:hypothetical protein
MFCVQGSPATSLTAKTPLASVDTLWGQDKDERKEEVSKELGEAGGSESDESEADESDSQDSDGDGDSGDSETANGSVSDSEVSEVCVHRVSQCNGCTLSFDHITGKLVVFS